MVEAAPVRSRMTHCSFDSVASGSKARSTKVRVEHKTCSHVRRLTSALPCIPNREVRDAHIARHEEGFDNLLEICPTPKSWSDCCGTTACSKRREGRNTSKITCRKPKTPFECEVALLYYMGPQCPSKVCAARFIRNVASE